MKAFTPKLPGESVVLAFDFANQLPEGVTVASVDSVAVSVYRGTDPAPESLPAGAPALVGADVLQMVEAGVTGVDYLFVAWANLSDGQKRAVPALLPVRDRI